jgi:hypothetical protein
MVSLGGIADSEARRLHAARANVDYVTAFMEKWGSAVAITGGSALGGSGAQAVGSCSLVRNAIQPRPPLFVRPVG